MSLSKIEFDEIKAIVKEGQDGTVKAVRDMFISVGININDPIKVQAQMNFLAKTSKLADKIISKAVITIVALLGIIAMSLAAFSKLKGS
jgi:hypothetical protein